MSEASFAIPGDCERRRCPEDHTCSAIPAYTSGSASGSRCSAEHGTQIGRRPRCGPAARKMIEQAHGNIPRSAVRDIKYRFATTKHKANAEGPQGKVAKLWTFSPV